MYVSIMVDVIYMLRDVIFYVYRLLLCDVDFDVLLAACDSRTANAPSVIIFDDLFRHCLLFGCCCCCCYDMPAQLLGWLMVEALEAETTTSTTLNACKQTINLNGAIQR